MIATITDRTAAGARVKFDTGADQFPVVTDLEIVGDDDTAGILDQVVIATEWESEAAHQVGDVIVPATQNGFCYRVLWFTGDEGTSGEDEPTWPLYSGLYVSDGALTLVMHGKAPVALWDLDVAAHLVWKRKQALVISQYDVGLDARDQLKRSQLKDHIDEQVQQTAPFAIA